MCVCAHVCVLVLKVCMMMNYVMIYSSPGYIVSSSLWSSTYPCESIETLDEWRDTLFFWRGEVFSFHITVLNWREPSGKRRGLRRLEQVSFMKNRMWKKKELVKSARVFKHYGIFWSSFGVCEFLLRWLLNAVFPLFNGQSGPRVVLFSRLKTSALERCLYIAETLH